MRVLVVTGATSMLGVALITEAIKENCVIYAVTRKASKRIVNIPVVPQVHIVELDLDEYRTADVLPCSGAVFYHFAWKHTNRVDRDDPVLQEKNVQYTLDAVEWAHRSGCKKFIGAGSQAEYGRVQGMIDASTKPNPETSYGACKLAAGVLSRNLCDRYGMVHIWTRVLSVYGPHDGSDTMISYAIRQFLQGHRASFSSGRQLWDYLYESDAGNFFYLLGKNVNANGIYPVASGVSCPLKEFVLAIAKEMGCEALCDFAPESSPDTIALQADVEKLILATGYSPQMTFNDGIRQIIRSYQ